MQPTPRRLGFGPQLRLRSKLQFDAIYAGGRRIDDRFFALRVKPNGLAHPRIGLAVAVKTAGNAVARNRLRRQIRESFASRNLIFRRSTSWWPQNFPRVRHQRQRCVLASRPFGNASQRHALRPEISDSRVPARHQPVPGAELPLLSVVLAIRDRGHRSTRLPARHVAHDEAHFPLSPLA